MGAWGYFLYFGAIDPLGGINSLWPLFGIANQMLATVALCVVTTALIRRGKGAYAFVTMIPLVWLVAVTMTAGFEKIFSPMTNVGFLSHAEMLRAQLATPAGASHAADIARQIWNDRMDTVMTVIFIAVVAIILVESARACLRHFGRAVAVPEPAAQAVA